MNAAEIKSDLLSKIDSLNGRQLKDVYGLLQNYINGINSADEWDKLSPQLQQKIQAGLSQANAGMTTPVAAITDRLRKKYGLNG